MKPIALFLWPLAAVFAVAGDDPHPAPRSAPAPLPRPITNAPPAKLIQWVVLSQVTFKDADLEGALEYLRSKAEEQSGGALKLHFERKLPADFRPRHDLTLDLRQVPCSVALNYLAELAGVQFSITGATVTVRPGAGVSLRGPLPSLQGLPPAPAPPEKGLAGSLAKPVEPTFAGRNVYRNTRGVIIAEKSGYVPHRSMGGFPIDKYPSNFTPVDCPHLPLCLKPCAGATSATKERVSPAHETPPR